MKNRKRGSVPSGDDEGKYSKEFMASLRQSLSDYRNGRTVTFDEIKKKLRAA
ncbi:MAG: hypothetical protein AB1657_00145 [Candidatus Micrarchaeota archaeon]